jgi:F0F1-type ATP synthase assembly protein I
LKSKEFEEQLGVRWHRWQRNAMNEQNPKQNSMAGGVFIAIGLIGGAITGVFWNEPSAGMVIGLIAGIAVATLVWLFDRKRGN